VYVVVKDKLESSENPLITPESIQEATKTLKSYIKSLNGKEESVHSLIQLLHTVHGKQREFTTELVAILQREALLQNAKLNKANNDLIKEKGKLERKLKAANEKLEDIRVNNEKVGQLQKDYTLNISTLSNCEQQIKRLQGELTEARELAEQLESAANSNSQIETLQQALKEKIELADQLKTALESKQRENKALEKNSLEANYDLEQSIKQHEVTITSLKKQCQTLQGENTVLQQELDSTKQLNNQINDTKNETQKNLNTISIQSKTQDTRIKNLEFIQYDLEQQVRHLKLNIGEFEEREKLYREAELLYEKNFDDIADQTYDTTRFLEELRDSSICKELNSKGTQTTLDLQLILKRNTDQANLISALQDKNFKLLNKPRVKISTMGMGAGPGHGAGGNNSDNNNPQNPQNPQDPTADTSILDNVAKPIVKVLGELFSREDKKSIPTFKGKSTDKLITEWLKTAEHVARNNDWDEEQKLRFFSDRLKGEALSLKPTIS
jgi:myosin heavy subunit